MSPKDSFSVCSVMAFIVVYPKSSEVLHTLMNIKIFKTVIIQFTEMQMVL